MKITILLPFLCAASLTAQTQLVRGDVDKIQGTPRFRLECTNIELVSTTVDLLALHNASRQQDIEYEMQVRNVSQGGTTILNVVSATAIPEMFDMGNLRIGRSDTWEVLGTPLSTVGIFVSIPSLSGYTPIGASGTWLIGTSALLARGTTNGLGRFQFSYQPPNIPTLVGMEFTGQAALVNGNVLTISNPDCRTVRPN